MEDASILLAGLFALFVALIGWGLGFDAQIRKRETDEERQRLETRSRELREKEISLLKREAEYRKERHEQEKRIKEMEMEISVLKHQLNDCASRWLAIQDDDWVTTIRQD